MRLSPRAVVWTVLLATCPSLLAQCPDLAPLDDQTGISTALVMAEVAPGQHIVLFNRTDADIALSATTYQLCSPFAYARLSLLAPAVTVPARGYASVPWPGTFTDTNAGGEVILYLDNLFGTSTHIMDYVCWGVNPHASRQAQALGVGKWSGACNQPLSNGAIRRRIATDGRTAASYDVTATPSALACTPDCAPVLAPTDDGTGIAADLILSEIRPGEYFELYNTTGAPIDLGSAQHELCSPFAYLPLSLIAPDTVVPAEGYAVVPWIAGFTDTAAGGEIQLYSDALDFEDASRILDFVCWGTNPHGSRKAQAESVGKWSGPCAPAMGDGSLHRLVGTSGSSAGSYDANSPASPQACSGAGATSTPRPTPRAAMFERLRATPNPFNPLTLIQFTLREEADVRIRIFSADGRFVDRIDPGRMRAGERSVRWLARDERGRRLPSGVYLYQVEAGRERAAGKMVLVE